MGSAARCAPTSNCSAANARKAPPAILSMPITTQPGPATSTAPHQRRRLAAVRSGRKRKKSTCSPICTTSEKITAAAAPNMSGSNWLLPLLRPDSPAKSWYSCGWASAIHTKGSSSKNSHSGCVHACRRDMSVMPRMARGSTTSDDAT
ncbi:hypothetical protein D3C71_1038630 [compost metagenome]